MTARMPKPAPPREDTRTIRLTPDYLADAEIVRIAIGEVSATGVVRALLCVARLAAENAELREKVGRLEKISQAVRALTAAIDGPYRSVE